jgi:hypothetical protein
MATLAELTDQKIERVRRLVWNERAYMKFTYTKVPWKPEVIDEGAWGKLYDPYGQQALDEPADKPIDICLPTLDYQEDAWEEYSGILCEEQR